MLNLSDLNGDNGFKIPGNYYDSNVSTGDINNDGFSDLVIGLPSASEDRKGEV